MKRWGEQSPVHFDEKELKTDLGEGDFIFVGSSCDMFAKEIPHDWIEKTLDKTRMSNSNKYLFLTKNPERYLEFDKCFPSNFIFGTTIETNRVHRCMQTAPKPEDRAAAMDRITAPESFISIEPVIDFDTDEFAGMIKNASPDTVFIGADSGNNHLPEPSPEKIAALIEALRSFAKVHLKTNLKRLYKEEQ
jgi:protein gp37